MFPRKRNYKESSEQVKFIMRIRWLHPEILIFAVPNGGTRSKLEAARLKKEGLLKGIPDVIVAKRTNDYGGLYLEFKTAEGKLSPEQVIIHNKLTAEGYKVEVVRSCEDALAVFKEYIG